MHPLKHEFVSQDPRKYRFKLGTHVATSLSGFIAGAVVSSIIWGIIVYFLLVK